jgi:predicted nucleic acid-binding protein
MTDYSKVFIDTAPLIYFIEKDSNNPQYYEKVKSFFQKGYENDKRFITSVITVEELS